MKLLTSVSLGLILAAGPAAAIETCRFIEAKAEREACYNKMPHIMAVAMGRVKPGGALSGCSTRGRGRN